MLPVPVPESQEISRKKTLSCICFLKISKTFIYLCLNFTFMQYVPCYYRNQVLSLISLWKDEAFEDGFEDEDFDLVFGTTEELSYKIKFTDGNHRSKFHGPGWEKLIRDYDLFYGDIIKLDLQAEDFFFPIDLMLSESRGGHKAFPKPSVGMF